MVFSLFELISRSVRQVSNLTVPPNLIISLRRFFTTSRRLSVPTCGVPLQAIFSGAPALISSVKIYLERGSFMRVYNFPSEKVPAPPSPNWMFDFGLKVLFWENASTSLILASTSLPLSIRSGLSPALANRRVANRPHGPLPTTTIFLVDLAAIFSSYTKGSWILVRWWVSHFLIVLMFLTSTSMEWTKRMSLLRESIVLLTIW